MTRRDDVQLLAMALRDALSDEIVWRSIIEDDPWRYYAKKVYAHMPDDMYLSISRDQLMQEKVKEYAVALAIATNGSSSEALRAAETWLSNALPVNPSL